MKRFRYETRKMLRFPQVRGAPPCEISCTGIVPKSGFTGFCRSFFEMITFRCGRAEVDSRMFLTALAWAKMRSPWPTAGRNTGERWKTYEEQVEITDNHPMK